MQEHWEAKQIEELWKEHFEDYCNIQNVIVDNVLRELQSRNGSEEMLLISPLLEMCDTLVTLVN